MTIIDQRLQTWRIRKALPWLRGRRQVLDIGCHQGEMLLRIAGQLTRGTGIDPCCIPGLAHPRIALIRGRFPDDLPAGEHYDAITALALIEHLPEGTQETFFQQCHDRLLPGGLLICTIPHPWVDHILWVLMRLRLIKGMEAEAHHGYDVRRTSPLAQAAGFAVRHQSRFQLGLNHLFVFEKR